MNAGKLPLAISATKRSPAAPELPTVAEAGIPGYEVDQWYGHHQRQGAATDRIAPYNACRIVATEGIQASAAYRPVL